MLRLGAVDHNVNLLSWRQQPDCVQQQDVEGTGAGVLVACGADNQSTDRQDNLYAVVGRCGFQVSGVYTVVAGRVGVQSSSGKQFNLKAIPCCDGKNMRNRSN